MNMQKEIDPETQKIQNMQRDVANFVKGDVWKRVKRNLLQKLSNLDSVKNIRNDDSGKERTPEDIVKQIEIRGLVIDLILGWLDEIDGEANQGEGNREILDEVRKDDYIIPFEEEE